VTGLGDVGAAVGRKCIRFCVPQWLAKCGPVGLNSPFDLQARPHARAVAPPRTATAAATPSPASKRPQSLMRAHVGNASR